MSFDLPGKLEISFKEKKGMESKGSEEWTGDGSTNGARK